MKNLIVASLVFASILAILSRASILKSNIEKFNDYGIISCRVGYLGAASRYWDKTGENPNTVLKIANQFCKESSEYIKERLQN
jgi:hypothetical protein